MLFVNNATPELQIYNPDTGEWAKFAGGKLEIDEDHPDYRWVLAEAQRNPAISIHTKGLFCPECGEGPFTGSTRNMELGKHRKNIHFDAWLKDQDAAAAEARDLQVKSRAGYVCDVCQPVQEFGTEGDLAEHTRLLHAVAPQLTESGETIGADGETSGGAAPAPGTDIPAATPSES